MTAETSIYVLEKKDLLVVPSKALRFTPDQILLMSYMKNQPKPEMADGAKNDGMPGAGKMDAPTEMAGNSAGKMVWVKRDSVIHPVPVQIGLDDDIHTEILGGLKQGDEVILSMEQTVSPTVSKTAASNPFMPKPPGANKK